MFIKNSPERGEMTFRLSPAHQEDLIRAGGKRIDIFDEVGKMPGIEVIERFDPESIGNFDCIAYVFKHRMKADWYNPVDFNLEQEMRKNTVNFFKIMGYRLIDVPCQDDVIAYVSQRRPGFIPRVAHWGVYDQEKVISKFGLGHIYRHSISSVPYAYGNAVLFFRPPSSWSE